MTTTKAKLGKRYTNHVGNVFQRVEVVSPTGASLATYDIKVRTGRDGLVTISNKQCLERGLYLYEQSLAGLRHSSTVSGGAL